MPAIPQKRRPAQRATTGQIGPWKLYSLLFVSLTIVVTGFFFAGRLHFSSWDYSMKNSRLRKQVDELETEKRRLILAREVAQSPNEIKRAARKFGMNEPDVATLALNAGGKSPATSKDRVIAPQNTSGKRVDSQSDNYTVLTASLKLPTAKSARSEGRKTQAE